MAITTTTRKSASAVPANKTNPTKTKPAPTNAKALAGTRPVQTQAVKTTTPSTDKKKDKTEKIKVVRDSFTIPKAEYAQIAAMKKRAVELGLETKKSELIRAGLLLLAATSDTAFRKALGNVPTLKTGRPGKV